MSELVELFSKSIASCNILKITTGTNSPRDRESITILEFSDEASTNMSVIVDGVLQKNVSTVKLVFGGNTECVTLTEALEYAVKVLKYQRALNVLKNLVSHAEHRLAQFKSDDPEA